jgi:hypothetical protein
VHIVEVYDGSATRSAGCEPAEEDGLIARKVKNIDPVSPDERHEISQRAGIMLASSQKAHLDPSRAQPLRGGMRTAQEARLRLDVRTKPRDHGLEVARYAMHHTRGISGMIVDEQHAQPARSISGIKVRGAGGTDGSCHS